MCEYDILFFEEFVDRINLIEYLILIFCVVYCIDSVDMYCKICDLLMCKECRRSIDYEGYDIVLIESVVDLFKLIFLLLLDFM